MDGSNGGEGVQFDQDRLAADVARMKNQLHAAERVEDLGPH